MRTTKQRAAALASVAIFALFGVIVITSKTESIALAQATTPTPTPAAVPAASPAFDQAAAVAKLREQIKGREQEPAGKVFKNVTGEMLKNRPAAQLLSVMEFGYARSLGVTCTHCHIPDKWESEENPDKQMARDMSAMVLRLNNELLKGIKNMPATAVVNCTTCHRGQVKPATNLPAPPRS
jgi:hypothetical protein